MRLALTCLLRDCWVLGIHGYVHHSNRLPRKGAKSLALFWPSSSRRRGSSGAANTLDSRFRGNDGSARAIFFAIFFVASCAYFSSAAYSSELKNQPPPACKPVYLTLDTGHMEVAPAMAQVLSKHKVQVTFFAANEATKVGDGSLGTYWAPWWKARAAEGHAFASHTWSHAYWRADLASNPPLFKIRPSAGDQAGQNLQWTAAQYCQDLGRASARLQELTGQKPLPLFRAPGGKTSALLLKTAQACGYAHVGWSPAGFLGDELPSASYSNAFLLQKALRSIAPGDILLAHLGIWSRLDPWAPAVLEPLVVGLQARGFCFRTLREHPQYRAWIAAH